MLKKSGTEETRDRVLCITKSHSSPIVRMPVKAQSPRHMVSQVYDFISYVNKGTIDKKWKATDTYTTGYLLSSKSLQGNKDVLAK